MKCARFLIKRLSHGRHWVSHHIGIHVGDLFTDLVVGRPDGFNLGKTPTTSADQAKDVLNGRGDAAGSHDLTPCKAAEEEYGVIFTSDRMLHLDEAASRQRCAELLERAH
jgi:hypothetical protein